MLSIIIPAYNEAPRIGTVVQTALSCRGPREVIVSDDCSTDGTVTVVRGSGAKILRLAQHGGKGAAMAAGIREARGSTILFLDADLTGLTVRDIGRLGGPVLSGQALMVVAKLPYLVGFDARHISGVRAINRKIAGRALAMGLSRTGYGADATIDKASQSYAGSVWLVALPNVWHVRKVSKWGLTGLFRTITAPFEVLGSM